MSIGSSRGSRCRSTILRCGEETDRDREGEKQRSRERERESAREREKASERMRERDSGGESE